ncbi:MAG: type II secretion system protein GspD [Verrucomicrobiota bacterium]
MAISFCCAEIISSEKIENLLEQGRFAEARSALDAFPDKKADEKRALKIKVARAFAKQAAKKKDWAAAEKEFEEALRLDPDNRNIVKLLKEIRALRDQFAQYAARAVQESLHTEIRDAWSHLAANPLSLDPAKSIPMTRQNNFLIHQKLEQIILPEVEFSEAKIEDIAFFLTEKSRKYDPQKTGVSFLTQDEAKRQAKLVSLSLRKIPVKDVLEYVAQLAAIKYRVEEKAVLIEPLVSSRRTLVTREFFIRRQFLFPDGEKKSSQDASSEKKQDIANDRADLVKKALQSRGVVFENPLSEIILPDGTARRPRPDEFSSAVYSPATGILTVRNTQDQIDYLEQLTLSDMANQGVEKIIKVETRILEINQTDLEELGINWILNHGRIIEGGLPGSRSGSHWKLSAASADTHLRGANELSQSGLDNFLDDDQGISQNTFAVRGLLDGVTFEAVLNALNQKKSVNLVSAPTILVNSGSGGATIEVAREFIYPTAWDPPQVKLFRKDRFGGDEDVLERVIVPAWPSEFHTPGRKIGVCIDVVKAQADDENKKVSLELKPTITDFDGFINYGMPILFVPNDIRVPVFTVRAFDEGFKLDIQDGYTMVVGGLIREETQTIEDKVPLLGDIPLLGHLFRSKVNHSVRKNLILFVTPRILQANGEPVNP